MTNAIHKTVQHIRAECYKLKATPALYLALVCGFLVTIIIYLGHSIDIHSLSELNRNPWGRYFSRAMAIYSIFVIGPFVILLVSAQIYIEENASAWKFLYTLPTRRGHIYLAKLMVLLGLIAFSCLILMLTLLLSAYLLNYIHPDYEFQYYRPKWSYLFHCASHSFIAVLGVVGLQYCLTMRFKHFLLPTGIGLLGFVLGMIAAAVDNKAALYFPYAHPMIVTDYGMFRTSHTAPFYGTYLSNVECYSLAFFFFFILVGYWYETRRAVH